MASKPLASTQALDLVDIQRLAFTGYGTLPYARYLVARITDLAAFRSWLGEQSALMEAASTQKKVNEAIHLAFTMPGLEKLGLSQPEKSSFSREFTEGMATPSRARILGDVAGNDPKEWRWGGDIGQPVDVLLLLFATDKDALKAFQASKVSETEAGLSVIQELDADPATFQSGREHFGFLDGLSQPALREQGPSDRDGGSENRVGAGEFILGYKNEYGQTLSSENGNASILHNGSYLVFRQLKQDVPAFWRDLVEHAKTLGPDAEEDCYALAARFVGRDLNGCPLVTPDSPDASKKNFPFNYEKDPEGLRCPFGAHIRRANPRDSLEGGREVSIQTSNRHRILRRGRPYGPSWFSHNEAIQDALASKIEAMLKAPEPSEGDKERGLHFICLNSDIARQFEFIQATWMNNVKFAGLYNDPDPIAAGTLDPNSVQYFTIPGNPVRQRISGIQTHVKMVGGAYFFLPGLRALKRLATTKS